MLKHRGVFKNSVYANVPYVNVFSFDKWRISTAEVLSYFSKKENEQEFKTQFATFKKSIAAFEKHGYIKNNFYQKDRKTKMFDVSELKTKYQLYINQIFFEDDEFHEKASIAINNFLESPEYYSRRFTFGDSSFTYKELNIQGTSNVENTKRCTDIIATILKEAGLNVSNIETIQEMRKNNAVAQKIGSFSY